MSADLIAEEAQPHARYPGVGLVVRLEHPGQRLGSEHGSVLVGAAAQKRGDVASHVAGGGVDRAGADGRDLTVGDRRESAGAQRVSRSQVRPQPLGSDEVRAFHAEGAEHPLAKVAVEQKPTDVLDDLAQRGEPVIGVDPLGARLDVDTQPPSVVLGKHSAGRPTRAPQPSAGRSR